MNFDYGHLRPDGTSYRTIGDKVYVEIICIAYLDDPESAYQLWKNSTPHYNVYMNGSYNTAGIVCFEQGLYSCWVMHFSIDNLNPVKKLPSSEEKVFKVKMPKVI